MELHNLFLEMQQMVEMQQETIVNIEKSSEGVNYELEEGNKHVTTAVSTAKSTRKKKVVLLYHICHSSSSRRYFGVVVCLPQSTLVAIDRC